MSYDYEKEEDDDKCKRCGKYNYQWRWCKSCQINDLRKNFTNWTSGNEKIDSLIQGKQLEIDKYYDIIVEWISYNQLDDNKELEKDEYATIYSAIWKDGPLRYDNNEREYSRKQSTKVNLKLYNSQNINEFLNEVNNNELKIYGISQNPYTKNYIILFPDGFYCNKCGNAIEINSYNDIIFEWIPYNQFDDIKEIGKGGFAKVYSAIWVDGPLLYNSDTQKYTRNQYRNVALKCLYNSQNITSEFLNEAKLYSIENHNNYYNENKILKIYGISQNPDTKEYIIVLDYAKGGDFNYWMNKNYNNFEWSKKLPILFNISMGLKEIHQKKMIHRDFHAGNILLNIADVTDDSMDDSVIHISDMGLCGDASNINRSNIYGVIPYVAPEVLKGELYTQAADVYSFGMIMYFVATGKQPFADCAHDEVLVLNICNGNRPEINIPEAPKCYIDLMKQCWDSNPDNRPKATEVDKLIMLFYGCYDSDVANFEDYTGIIKKEQQHYEIEKQFEEAEEYRKSHLTSFDENKRLVTHSQAIYTSRLLNPFTKNIQKYDNINNNTVEIIDFTKL